MKTSPWKDAQHERIRRQTQEFLAQGGRIREVAPGESGMRPDGPRHHQPFSGGPRSTRTPVPEVVASIEARKQARRQASRVRKRPQRGPKRKLVYDDFGEPLRWVWVDNNNGDKA